jgi:drug/metabolite transporter (DMT)-like permease
MYKRIIPILFGFLMASIDVSMLGIIKSFSIGSLKSILWMVVPTVVYAIQPWIFLKSLSFTTMITMNLMWDILSDILVTGVGLFYFKEKVSSTKLLGILFAFVSIFLLTYEDD